MLGLMFASPVKTRGTFHGSSIKPNFPIQPVDMQLERAVQMDGRPSEVLHFFRSSRLERKLPFQLQKISTDFYCSHFARMEKTFLFDTKIFRNSKLKTENFG